MQKFHLDLANTLKQPLDLVGGYSKKTIGLWNAWFVDNDPEKRMDERFARLTAELVNAILKTDTDWRAFMPPPKKAQKTEQSDAEMERLARAFNASFGGKLNKTNRNE